MKTKIIATNQARPIVDNWAIKAVVVSWIPGSTIVLTRFDIQMIRAVAKCYEIENPDIETIMAAVTAGTVGKWLSESLSAIPLAGWAIKAIIAGSVTKAIGEAIIGYMWNNSSLPHELRIQNAYNGKVIDVAGFSDADGSMIHLWDYCGGSNQKWSFAEASNGYIQIVSMHCPKVIDIPDKINSGNNAQIWSYWGGDNQQFRLEKNKNGAFSIYSFHTDYVLSALADNMDNGCRIRAEKYTGDERQQWHIHPA